MKERFDFVYETVKKAITDMQNGAIGVDQAKATASLAKQANVTISLQIEAAKFMANNIDHEDHLKTVGLMSNEVQD